jgi:hypothetical protein
MTLQIPDPDSLFRPGVRYRLPYPDSADAEAVECATPAGQQNPAGAGQAGPARACGSADLKLVTAGRCGVRGDKRLCLFRGCEGIAVEDVLALLNKGWVLATEAATEFRRLIGVPDVADDWLP